MKVTKRELLERISELEMKVEKNETTGIVGLLVIIIVVFAVSMLRIATRT